MKIVTQQFVIHENEWQKKQKSKQFFKKIGLSTWTLPSHKTSRTLTKKIKYNKDSRKCYLNKVYKNICYTCGVFTLKLELWAIFVSVNNPAATANLTQISRMETRKGKQTGGGFEGGKMCVSMWPQKHHSSLPKVCQTGAVVETDLCKVDSVHTGSCFRHDECETSPSPTTGTGDFSVWSTSSTAGEQIFLLSILVFFFFLQGNDKLEPFFLCPCVHEAWSTKQTSSTLQPGCWESPGNWKLSPGNCPLEIVPLASDYPELVSLD